MSSSTDLELKKLSELLVLLEKTAELIQKSSPKEFVEAEAKILREVLEDGKESNEGVSL